MTTFTLRPLERSASGSSLDQVAFRVHLPVKEMKALGLSSGDIIRMSSTRGFHGHAVAWVAQQTNPGNKPIAKITDVLREKYDMALADPVIIEKSQASCQPIDIVKVRLSGASGVHSTYASVEELKYWIGDALVRLSIIIDGAIFDVQKQVIWNRSTVPKLRASIEGVSTRSANLEAVYFDPLHSVIALEDGLVSSLAVKKDGSDAALPLQIASHGIGGLDDQIMAINKRLARLTKLQHSPHTSSLVGPTTFLIHGPEGCGKTMLLDRLLECPWRCTIRLDQHWLGDHRKGHLEALSQSFEDARAQQPALIVMDDLDRLLEKAEALEDRLHRELKSLAQERVVVAAATRNLYNIDARLRVFSGLKVKLELTPPTLRQREAIFHQIIGPDHNLTALEITAFAERTHGFVGRDIQDLCGLAMDHCLLEDDSVPSDDAGCATGRLQQADFEAVFAEVHPTVLKEAVLEVPKVRWSDIAGVENARKLLEDITVRPYKNPELDTIFGSQTRKGVLLYGPPGCAKTLIAQAVATESNLNFLAVKGSELIKMYVGESERAIREVFRRARSARPCVIFFDEIDSIGKSRDSSHDSGLNVVATLLNEMDGIEALREVFIIGATNRPDILDSALIRTGRFDAHIHIGLPNLEARRQIIEIHTRKLPLADDVDLASISTRTEGSSGADLKGLCAVAVDFAKSDYERSPSAVPQLSMSHFERALEQHVPHTDRRVAARYEDWRPGKMLAGD